MFLEWKTEEDEVGILLRTFLRHRHISKQLLASVKYSEGGKIEVNGTEENVLYHMQPNDVVRLTFPPEKENAKLIAEHGTLNIIYEDDFILVLNKPPGMASIPAQFHPSGSVANHLKGYYETKGLKAAIHIVTRLDRDTSGLMLVAKNRFSHARLSATLQNGLLKRRYQALVTGNLDQPSGSIEAPIGRKKDLSIMERIVTEDGRYAKTNYNRLASYQDFDHLEIELETGRTHQIRVHFSHIGHPLLGDDMYGGTLDKIGRQALHSYHLHLVHPFTEEYLEFNIPLSTDLAAILTKSIEK
ncbi:ribosomal large subunit pseudouridine synthase [Listeria floridensis FSL S10-1187]|uniref:Pseudouridine synthase n=1 Tax=Listeria floridensis FSL S10-1187 TaxID=1265817 RepID=A0ABN0RER7_9LIST|nr:RluA family pseudouridine synthase [Listeria floridensis]EUJ31530.1 ribosomal large subunit pseudouridine synthase [Listeria floridensis FSL S10-1187]